jgi:Fibronectin type III domain/Divergent InlB B-repeat domain
VGRVPRIVAAAALGAVATGPLVGALTFSAGSRGAATQVTLQVAPRAPGEAGATVSTDTPGGVDLDNPGQPAAACNEKSTEESSCHWGFPGGTTVKLTASATGAGFAFAGWSTPECPGTGSCTVTLDDDYTSIVALFTPLRLGVRFSVPPPPPSPPPPLPARTVTSTPPGIACTFDGTDGTDVAGCQHDFAPNTAVQLTATGDNFSRWSGGFCEPANARTCTIRVVDYTSWAGAVYDDEPEPQLATTIKVQFQVRKGGDGSGRVTASNIDCGARCSTEVGYGKEITLTATHGDDSVFDGWNGVCARTQRTCTFAVGPITRIKALFSRDATPPSAPGDLRITSATRGSVSIAWSAATDNVDVKGYRVYVANTSVADVTTTQYTLAGLACGRTYDVAVDAVDGAGNRSQKARTAAKTKPCPLAVRLTGVAVVRHGGARTVIVRLRVNRATTARLTLTRKGRVAASGRFTTRPGRNVLRLAVRRRVAAGRYRLKIAIVDPDGGRARVFTRGVRLRRR